VMFDGGTQDPGSARVFVMAGPEKALYGQVVGLSPTRGENYLGRVGSSGRRQRFARIFHRAPCPTPGSMEGGRVAGSRQLARHDSKGLG